MNRPTPLSKILKGKTKLVNELYLYGDDLVFSKENILLLLSDANINFPRRKFENVTSKTKTSKQTIHQDLTESTGRRANLRKKRQF